MKLFFKMIQITTLIMLGYRSGYKINSSTWYRQKPYESQIADYMLNRLVIIFIGITLVRLFICHQYI